MSRVEFEERKKNPISMLAQRRGCAEVFGGSFWVDGALLSSLIMLAM